MKKCYLLNQLYIIQDLDASVAPVQLDIVKLFRKVCDLSFRDVKYRW